MKKQYLSAFALALFASTAFAQTNPVRTVDQVAVPNENTTGKDVYIVLGSNLSARINTNGERITGQATGSPVRIVTVNATDHVYKIYDVKSGKWFANKGGATATKDNNQVTLSDTPSEWYIYNNNNGSDNTLLDIAPKVGAAAISDGTIASWNFYQGYAVGKSVGYWDANDGNSAWRLYDPKTEINSNIDAMVAANTAAAETAKNEIAAATDEDGYKAAVKKFRKALDGKQVRFANSARGAKNYLSLTPSYVVSGNATDLPGEEEVFVLKYHEADDNYSLQHAVTGRQVDNVPGLNQKIFTTNGENARYDLFATGKDNKLSICNTSKNEGQSCLHLSADQRTDDRLNVVRWNPGSTSDASAWTLENADQVTSSALLAAAKRRFSKIIEGKELGYQLGTYGFSDEANTALSGPNTLAKFQQLISLHAENNLFGLNLPEEGQFFRILSNDGNYYVTTTGATDGEWQLTTTRESADPGTIFYYDGEKHLVSYTTGRGVYRTTNSKSKLAPYNVTNLATVDFGALTDGKYKVIVKQNNQMATVHLWQKNDKLGVDGSSGDNTRSELTHLRLQDVEKVPLHFNDRGLATFFAPVAMELPEGVEIYVATAYEPDHQRIRLEHFEGKVIPGGTAVLLRRGETASDIEIGYYYGEAENPVAQPTTNLFMGAASPTQFASGQEARALKDDEFLVLSTPYVRGFRAFLRTAPSSSTRSQLAFPGVTSVERVAAAENAAAPIFDLSGRRVAQPVVGQIYVQNGKKFLQR